MTPASSAQRKCRSHRTRLCGVAAGVQVIDDGDEAEAVFEQLVLAGGAVGETVGGVAGASERNPDLIAVHTEIAQCGANVELAAPKDLAVLPPCGRRRRDRRRGERLRAAHATNATARRTPASGIGAAIGAIAFVVRKQFRLIWGRVLINAIDHQHVNNDILRLPER